MTILVMGLTNIETTLSVEGFPIEYQAVRFPFNGIESHISGVGVNNVLALQKLGTQTHYLSLIANDEAGHRAKRWLEQQGVDAQYLCSNLSATPQSIIQYDPSGKRQIYVDLKDIQEAIYPDALFLKAVDDCDWLILGTLNISRPYLSLATQDFLRHSDVIFMSNEHIEGHEQPFALEMVNRFKMEVLVIGMGAQGALLYERKTGIFSHFAAQTVREVVNTVGAGDALFSAFMHFYIKNADAQQALQKAVIFAAWKIGTNGASKGFLSEIELQSLSKR